MARVESLRRPTREDAELKIGEHNKTWYDSPITSLLNNPTVKCTYWMINPNETTFSETANLVKSHTNTKRYTKINNFVMYGRDQEEYEAKRDTERSLSINLTSKQSVILGGSFEPKVGDHIFLHSHQHLQVPFEVTDVKHTKLNHKEAYLIEYTESTVYQDLTGLNERTVKELNYKSDNVGSGSSTLIDSKSDEAIKDLQDKILQIGDQTVEAFYNTDLDIFGYQSSLFGNYIFNHYANDMMQDTHRILTYGYDRNTLFFSNIYKFDRVSANYNTSIYERLLRRDFKLMSETFPEADDNYITSGAGAVFNSCLELRDRINAEYGINYIPKYSYNLKFYLREKSSHMIFCSLYNTDFILVDMLNTAGFIDPYLKSCYTTYELRHPIICQFLDAWMSNDLDWIKNNISLLLRYNVDKDNIDDYFGAPLLLFILKQVIGEYQKDVYVPKFAKNFKR